MQSSSVTLKALLARPEIKVKGILTLQTSKYNADFVDITGIATDAGVPVHYAEDIGEQELAALLRTNGVEIVFTIGWSRLLSPEILEIPCHGVVGFHPAALPQNRGRHPLIWALALGLEQTASTFFMMDDCVDSGPIISQETIMIKPSDDAQTLYDKVLTLLPQQINNIVDRFVVGDLGARPQNHANSTTWRKRSAIDGVIDWRMSAKAVYNLTRALTHPYPGAEFCHGDRLIKLWCCEIVTDTVLYNAEPGKVLYVDARGPVIKTGMGLEGGAVRILDTEDCLELYEGEYL